MVPGMMTKFKTGSGILIFLTFSFLCLCKAYSAESTSWVIAAEKFSLAKGQKESALVQNLSENLPSSILEKIGEDLYRNVLVSESLERTRFKLRTERQSLYLQLSAEYKKRDLIFLEDYSEKKLKQMLKAEDKKIQEIEKSLEKNLQSLREAEENALKEEEVEEKKSAVDSEDENQFMKFSHLIKKIFKEDDSFASLEKISFYKNDVYSLYNPSEKAKTAGYESGTFSKELYSAGINTLVTGVFSLYGDYISVSVSLYLYPEAKKIGSVMEVGNIQDIELLANSLAGQLVPLFTNALPVKISVALEPAEVNAKKQLYIDDVLQRSDLSEITLESGRHSFQITAEGYEDLSFSEYFEGNSEYKIEITMTARTEGEIQIGLISPLEGSLYINGEKADMISPQKYIIQLNGSHALGEFISADEETAFFYIPDSLYINSSMVKIKPKPMDREKYIDTRRKWMYASYSLLMVSLIPTFYTYGTFLNKVKLYNDYDMISYEKASKWQQASRICTGVSIACGVFWGFELVRYFMAANSVLPQKAAYGDVDIIIQEKNEVEETDSDSNPDSDEVSDEVSDADEIS